MTSTGQLSERIVFSQVEVGSDGAGGTIESVEERFTVWARRQFLRGGEGIQAVRLEGRQPVILTVRSSSQTKQITPAWRARDARSGLQYQIRSVEPSEDRAWIDLLCESGVAP